MVWMLVDAAKRRADFWWYAVIFMPFGEWIYFFTVKAKDPDMQALKDKWLGGAKGPALDKLRFQVRETPSVRNKITLAKALHDADKFGEAADLFGTLARDDPDDLESQFGLASCRAGLQEWTAAAEGFEAIVKRDQSYKDYWAWLQWIDALWETGERERALTCAAELVATSPRINHSVTYGHYLSEVGRSDEAIETIERALQEYKHSPAFTQRRDATWANRGRQVLKNLKRNAS